MVLDPNITIYPTVPILDSPFANERERRRLRAHKPDRMAVNDSIQQRRIPLSMELHSGLLSMVDEDPALGSYIAPECWRGLVCA
jgi:hypothetical protein